MPFKKEVNLKIEREESDIKGRKKDRGSERDRDRERERKRNRERIIALPRNEQTRFAHEKVNFITIIFIFIAFLHFHEKKVVC